MKKLKNTRSTQLGTFFIDVSQRRSSREGFFGSSNAGLLERHFEYS